MGAIQTQTSCKYGWYWWPALRIRTKARLKRMAVRLAYRKQDIPECMNSDTHLLIIIVSCSEYFHGRSNINASGLLTYMFTFSSARGHVVYGELGDLPRRCNSPSYNYN